MTHQINIVYTSYGNTLIKGKDKTRTSIMCLTMFDPTVGSTQYIYWLSKKWLSPIRARVNKATYYSLEKSFSCKGFLSTSEPKTCKWPDSAIDGNKQQHDVNFDFTMPFVIHLALRVSKPVSRTHKVNAILEHIHNRYMLCKSDING